MTPFIFKGLVLVLAKANMGLFRYWEIFYSKISARNDKLDDLVLCLLLLTLIRWLKFSTKLCFVVTVRVFTSRSFSFLGCGERDKELCVSRVGGVFWPDLNSMCSFDGNVQYKCMHMLFSPWYCYLLDYTFIN